MKYIAVLDSDDKLSKEAINDIKNTVFCGDEQAPYIFDIDSIEEVTDQLHKNGRWIPVSERMPDKTGWYLIEYSREICHNEMAVAYYSVEEKESDPNYEWEFRPMCGEYKEVVAWTLLPEPYKAEKEIKE